MKEVSKPVQIFIRWLCRIFGVLILLSLLLKIPGLIIATIFVAKAIEAHKTSAAVIQNLVVYYVVFALFTGLGIWFVRMGWRKDKKNAATPPVSPDPVPTVISTTTTFPAPAKKGHWSSCNILHTAPDANRLWQFDAKTGALSRETSSASGQPLPAKHVAKSWNSLWQPKLNVAWLQPENVFLRVVELPKSSFGETLSMVELQLEKLSPIPVAQIAWTLQILPQAPTENLQTVIVVIVARQVVEEFLGKLEAQGFLADRLEVPMLDELAAPTSGNGAWIYPALLNGQNAALVAWWFGGALRNVSYVVLPAAGDRAKSLKEQLAQLSWAGELEGWLNAPPEWHLIAEGSLADEWERYLREALGDPVQVTPPLHPPELAAQTARRMMASEGSHAALLPAEFSGRYREQFFDRLWLHGLFATGILYAVCVVIYFAATTVLGYQTTKVEQQVAALGGSYTNVLQLKARYQVLKERQDLKYAALDCWKLVADLLPEGITLRRFSFGDGQKLSLNGTVSSDEITRITDFYDALRKAKLEGKPVFMPEGGEQLVYHQTGNEATWNFSLELQHTDEKVKR